MPPVIKISKKEILDKGLEIIGYEGIEGINARNLAAKLKCSVQPIYYQFKNMDELKKELVNYAYQFYENYINNSKTCELKYLASGMAYIKFSKEKKNLFNLLFMKPHKQNIEDPTLDYVHQIVMNKTGLSLEKAKEFHFDMWIYVHGLATMVYTGIVNFKENIIEELLKKQYEALIGRYSK